MAKYADMDHKTFYRGAALDRHRFAALANSDGSYSPNRPFSSSTHVVEFDLRTGAWQEIAHRKWFGVGVARWPGAGAAGAAGFMVLSQQGDVLEHGEETRDSRLTDGPLAWMVSIDCVSGGLYAIGSTGCHFRYSTDGTWAPMSPEAYDPHYLQLDIVERGMRILGLQSLDEYDALTPDQEDWLSGKQVRLETPFFGIDGPSPNDLYLAGQNGALMQFDGEHFHDIDPGERSSLVSVLCIGEDVLVSGSSRGSVVLRGNARKGFTPIFRAPQKEVAIYGMTLFDGMPHFGDLGEETGGVYRLEDGVMRRLPGVNAPVVHVEAIDGVLWTLEQKAVNLFDGASWSRFESPFA